MGLTEEGKEEYHKLLVERYGHPDSWEIDHLKSFNVMLKCALEQWVYEYYLNNNDRTKDDRTKDVDTAAYQKEFLRLTLEANKLLALAKKMEHVEGVEPDEKFFLANKLLDDSLNLMQERENLMQKRLNFLDECNNLLQDEIDNKRTFIPKKPVGRPSFKFHYQWLDYLALELGSIQKAVNYACDFPMLNSRKPASLLRDYRKYRRDKGRG
jgi:hypothetical protein